MTSRLGLPALACAAVLLLAGCSGGSGGPAGTARSTNQPGASTAATREPTLSEPGHNASLMAAADRVNRMIGSRYAPWYAFTVPDDAQHAIVVYRRSGSDLDSVIGTRISGIRVIFRTAALSRNDMSALVDRITADIPYWKGRGITINSVSPRLDGVAVDVMTATGKAAEADELSRHYGQPIVVQQGAVTVVGSG